MTGRGAEREFRRAIQLNPQYATAHQWYAESLSWQGRFEEALAESEQARRLDPLSPIIGSDYASILYYSRQFDAALKQNRAVLELDPNFEHAQGALVPSYLQLARYDDAIDAINHGPEGGGGLWAWAWKAAVYGRET
jgi:tetratricopeptide (TPR) repeat protein